MDYTAVSHATKRFEERIRNYKELTRVDSEITERLRRQMWIHMLTYGDTIAD